MCKSCHETADNLGRRCPGRQEGFTAAEGTARTATRALNSMATALDRGDHATATRAATRAADARERLDLMADPDSAPEFQLLVHPSAVPDVEKALQAYRDEYPDALVDYRFDVHYKVQEGDMAVGQMWTNVIIRDRQLSQFAQRIRFPKGARTDATPVVSTYYALAAAISHNEQHGGYIKKGEPNASADAIVAKFRAPDVQREDIIPTTPNGIGHCIEAREYLQSMTPTNDFEARVKAVASKEFVEEKDVPLLAAGANTYWRRQQAQEAERLRAQASPTPSAGQPAASARQESPAAPESHGSGTSSGRAREGAWLGKVGDNFVVAGTVIEVQPVGQGDPRFGYNRKAILMETASGDRVRTFADVSDVREGDTAGLRGFVTAHSFFRGRKVTQVNEGYVGVTRHE